MTCAVSRRRRGYHARALAPGGSDTLEHPERDRRLVTTDDDAGDDSPQRLIEICSGIGGFDAHVDARGLQLVSALRAPCGACAADVFVGVEGIAARYGIGRTKAYAVVTAPGFLRSVVAGMHVYPLRALRAWELAVALDDVLGATRPAPAPPPARPSGRPRKETR